MKKIFSIFLMLVAVVASAQEIKWMSMNDALAAQKKTPKKIFMDVYTTWCGPCRLLSEKTFKNKDLVKYINDNFYAVKFNAEGNEEVVYNGTTYKNNNYDPAKANTRNGMQRYSCISYHRLPYCHPAGTSYQVCREQYLSYSNHSGGL